MQHDHPRRSVDGILLPGKAAPQSSTLPQPLRRSTTPRHAAQKSATPQVAPKRPFWKKLLVGIGQSLAFMLLLIFALFIQSAIIGQLAIILYGIAVFVWHISSRTTFLLVLGCFAITLYASVRADITLASVFAMYAFLLLIIGTLSLALEVRSEI